MMVTRSIDVFDPSVVTVGRITAGTTNNIIPETAEIDGTIRTVSESTRRRCTTASAASPRASPPPTAPRDGRDRRRLPGDVNSESFADFRSRSPSEMLGADRVVRMPNPIMGAEDFSYVLQRVPGSMMFLGGTPPDHNPATAPANHSNRVFFDEAAMTDGIALYAGMALRHLAGCEGR